MEIKCPYQASYVQALRLSPIYLIHRPGADVHILNPTRWMYRVRPSVAHRPLRPCQISAEVICFFLQPGSETSI